nr:GNAT family N-acetyltransferase [Xanthomonadaceae bacterium]
MIAGQVAQAGSTERAVAAIHRAAIDGIAIDSIRLRALRESDLADFHAYRSDPQVARYQGWQPMDEARALAFLRGQNNRSALEPGRWVRLAIADTPTDRLLGDIGLWLSHDRREAEIAITVAPSAQGRGVARNAIRAVFVLLSGEPALERIRADADARNLPSRRMLVAAGFREIGTAEVFVKEEACI